LVPSFEEAFQERMQQWRLDGKLRSGRGYTTYATLGEIMDVFRSVFGDYMEPAVF